MIIEHALEIEAPAEQVWSVVTDLDAYPAWNPFVVACASTLLPGDPIAMRVRVLPFLAQPQRERVFEHVPGRRLCYGLPARPLGALASSRSHAVEAISADRTRYVSRFELGGWLAPLVALLLGRRLEAGFTGMSEALKQRAEALARGGPLSA